MDKSVLSTVNEGAKVINRGACECPKHHVEETLPSKTWPTPGPRVHLQFQEVMTICVGTVGIRPVSFVFQSRRFFGQQALLRIQLIQIVASTYPWLESVSEARLAERARIYEWLARRMRLLNVETEILGRQNSLV